MSHPEFHVAIVGGGIGGLCLAQGLRKAGISVAVYERDRVRDERLQGYRIHIDPRGSRALHHCLPSALWDSFLATRGKGGGQFRFLTEQMEELLAFQAPSGADPIECHHSASRIPLRQVLLSGLQDIVHFDKEFVRYAERPDGRTRRAAFRRCDNRCVRSAGWRRRRQLARPQAVSTTGATGRNRRRRHRRQVDADRGESAQNAAGFIARRRAGDGTRPSMHVHRLAGVRRPRRAGG